MVETTTVSDHLRSPNFSSWLTEAFLENAFAEVNLSQIQEFHLWLLNINSPSCSQLSFLRLLETNKIDARTCFIIPCWNIQGKNWPALNTLIFSQWKIRSCAAEQWSPNREQNTGRKERATGTHRPGRPSRPVPNFSYELFNCNNFSIRYWCWNYRGCWHQTCPPVAPRVGFYI